MYSDEDLSAGVKVGIFQQQSVDAFQAYIASQRNTRIADEESFRLLAGFNDIFISIAAILLLVSAGWLFGQIHTVVGTGMAAVIAWLLSIFFVQRKSLALPGILFLIAFLVSVVWFGASMATFFGLPDNENPPVLGFSLGIFAAWLHWRTFQVPITLAAGAASLVSLLLAILIYLDVSEFMMQMVTAMAGVGALGLAMVWDIQDTQRKTRKSDVAFWLHLLAAPLLVHPIFTTLGVMEKDVSLITLAAAISIYVLLALLSVLLDRRALMVSALVYVLVAFKALFDNYGFVDSAFAISGVLMGASLLLLSVFWQNSRVWLMKWVPVSVQGYLPSAQ